jgi:CubicO group peptidase (beta-lactamase class C family)
MKRSLLLLLLAVSGNSLWAQTPDTAQLSKYLQTLADNNRFMGSVALSKNGTVYYQKAVGMANTTTNTPNTPQTLFRIGSISKSFTAAMILKAAEEGKLKLSDPLRKYVPKLPESLDATIEQTLRHRSGIHNLTSDPAYLTYNTQPQTEAQLMARIVSGGRDFPADSMFSYSNSGYILLSMVLEQVYKMPYAQILDTKLAKPLGLKQTGVYATGHNQNASYSWVGKWNGEKTTDLSVPMGAGNILSTPADVARFFNALLSGTYISPASVEQMKALKDGYGMGLVSFPYGTEKGYGHTGGIDGYHSMGGYFPESKIAFATISNGLNFVQNDIGIALLATAHGETITIPEFKAKNATTQPAGYAGIYSTGMMPVKFTVTQQGDIVSMQASGQKAFPLTALGTDQFEFAPAGIKVKFLLAENAFIIEQGGAEIRFEKD